MKKYFENFKYDVLKKEIVRRKLSCKLEKNRRNSIQILLMNSNSNKSKLSKLSFKSLNFLLPKPYVCLLEGCK